jgi:hypothetical protein
MGGGPRWWPFTLPSTPSARNGARDGPAPAEQTYAGRGKNRGPAAALAHTSSDQDQIIAIPRLWLQKTANNSGGASAAVGDMGVPRYADQEWHMNS